MDYEKKYKEALNRARNLYNSEETSADVEIACEKIFPELAESEEEKVRKWLIAQLKIKIGDNATLNNMIYKAIAWLEKQGEKKETLCDKCRKEQPSHSCQDITALGRCALENKYFASQENAGSDMTNGLTYKQSKCSTCINDKGCINCENENQYEIYAEKVDNQNCVKTTDKVEPKFKVGDWVIEPREGELNGLWHIEKIEDNNYWEGRTGVPIEYADKYYRLWTIQDAKDGDVLCGYPESDYPWIGIFHNLNVDGTFNSYCYLQAGLHGKFCPPSGENIFGERNINNHASNVYPATKEQRDLLFQKMKEAGYEWNAEKKELKKIEEINLTDFESALFTAFSDAWQQYLQGEEVNVKQWVKEHSSELLRIAKQNNEPAWSEEDEEMLTSILDDIMPFGECPDYPTQEEKEYYYEGNRKVQWLKSLKERLKGE